jgi:hypothetical protein
VGYEHTQVTDELNRNVQRAVGVSPRRHETLGELVKSIAPKRWVRRPENLISGEPTRHEVRVDGKVIHTFCFVDALMLPFVLGGAAVEVCSASTPSSPVRRTSVGLRRRRKPRPSSSPCRKRSISGETGPRVRLGSPKKRSAVADQGKETHVG